MNNCAGATSAQPILDAADAAKAAAAAAATACERRSAAAEQRQASAHSRTSCQTQEASSRKYWTGGLADPALPYRIPTLA